MTQLTAFTVIGYFWAALGLVWFAGIAFSKATLRRQPAGPRLFHLVIAFMGFTLLGSKYFTTGWLAIRVLPDRSWIELAGVLLTAMGCGFAIWARITIGANWSGQATLKRCHELITTGPYAFARHPIYTGLLAGALGSALVIGELRCALGILLILLALLIKMSQEEKLMTEAFPDAYPKYRAHVKALIPGVL